MTRKGHFLVEKWELKNGLTAFHALVEMTDSI